MTELNKLEATQEVQTIQSVSENLSELLTNSVNMVDKYYEIFFDPTPHYVELEQYNSDGELLKTLVPNRALDRSVALSGVEDPENVVYGVLGSLYVNTITRDLFIKKTAEGNNGWVNITPQKIELYTESFIVDSDTTSVLLLHKVQNKENIDIYIDGRHLEDEDFDIAADKQTVEFHTHFPNYGKLQVKYINGLYGLKGDTAISVNVGKVETANSETPASVINSGDDENLVLDFVIPKGETGDTGVWIGSEAPVKNNKYLDDKLIWIDTSAEGYSEEDLGITRIFDSGNNTNPTAYKRAYNIMHSSIDESKLTKLGDVNIDDNGILTAYGNGSGVRTPVKVKQLVNKNWSISGKDYINTKEGAYQYLFNIGGQNTNSIVFFFRSSNKSFCFHEKSNDIVRIKYDENNVDIYDVYGDGWYNWKVEYIDGVYNIYISYQDNPLTLRFTQSCEQLNQPLEEYIYISADNLNNYSQMKSNLATYVIKIDGDVIWTPNKTGYEIISDDRFNSIGNPVITDSGILTNVTNGKHFIYGDYNAEKLLNKSWCIEGSFLYTGVSQVLWQFADPYNIEARPIESDMFAGDYKMLSIDVDSNTHKVNFNLRTGTVDNMSNQQTFAFDIILDKEYKYKFSYNEYNSKYIFTLMYDDVELTQDYIPHTPNKSPLVCSSHPEYNIVIGSDSCVNEGILDVYINLNNFKIFNRNKLVYRPLFKIPCTYAKSGACFVDASFRKLVQEAYDLHNKGHMFIIDDNHKSVTLPLDDIYSLIQREYETRPKYGKGLKYNSKTNTLENLTQGSEIGDIGESVFVDETSGLRRALNGQIINVTKDTEDFAKYVLQLKNKGLVVTNEEWELEANANGVCNKFVMDIESKTKTTTYYAYIPETFVIRTPIIEENETPDSEINVPERYCKNCGALLASEQVVCNECFTVNELIEYNSPILKDSNITQEDISEHQATHGVGNTNEDNVDDIPEEEDKIIGYETSISDELTEADIVYITSFDILERGVEFRKIDGIIYPEHEVTVKEILNEDLFYRYEKADFEVTEEVESANYIRLPKLNATKAGYDCYIQVATGVKTTVDVENTYTHISPFSYGMYQYSDIELNNPGWLLSEGQWNSGAMYPSFYRWIRKQIDLGRDRFKLWNNPNYSVNRYDYVINETDGTFRLPLVASVSDFAQQRFLVDKKEATDTDPTWYNIYSDGWCEQGGKEVILSGSAAALNFTSKNVVLPIPILHAINWNVQPRHDCFQGNMGAMNYMGSYESVVMGQKNFVAGTAYTNPWVVWSLEGYISEITLAEHFKLANLYFYVGDTVQTNNHVDTGKMMEDLAKLRAELEYAREKLNNTLSVPSGTYTNITCPASGGTYTTPADGWMTFRRTATGANQWLMLTDNNTGLAQIQWLPATGNYAIINIPVRKGAVIKIEYSAGTHNYLRFIPERGVAI